MNQYTYSQDEYNRYLDGQLLLFLTCARKIMNLYLDKEWTKDETDYLFSIAKDYDLRWYVIYDRYDFAGGPQRTLEVSFAFSFHIQIITRKIVGFKGSLL